MGLESCMICLDNSEHTRNGDYMPTRLGAQIDATNMLISRKLNPPSHPESTVGVLAMGGKAGATVRVSPTRDQTKLLTATHEIECGGSLSFCDGIKIAQLALKHRQNKAGEQRILAFVCSPVLEKEKTLKKLANFLRKEGIAVDIVSMGETEANEEILLSFLKTVDKDGENSHLITVPAGTLPSTVLRTHALFGGGTGGSGASGTAGGAAAGGAADAGFGEYGGIDPNEDPEMAMVIQMSLMEERARLEASAATEEGTAAADGAATGMEVEAAAAPTPAAEVEMTEDELLQQALQLSMMEEEEEEAAAPAPAAAAPPVVPTATDAAAEVPALPGADAAAFSDPSFVQGMLATLPGVDMSDPRILAAINQLSGGEAKEGEEKKEEEKES